MPEFEFAFICGGIVGTFIGWWFGRISLLLRMRHDEHTGVDSNYDKRKKRYLGKGD